MLSRPWPIVILAWLHILAPIGNLLASCYLSGQAIMDYIRTFHSPLDAIAFFTFFPIAGIAIFCVRKWSYPVFLAAVAWSFFLNYQSYRDFPQFFPAPLFVLIYLINIGLVTYFLIPAVREVYFNKRIRWWESAPRYKIPIPVAIEGSQGTTKSEIRDISEGGVFIKPSQKLIESGELVVLKFTYVGLNFKLTGRVVHGSNKSGYGIQFTHLNRKNQKTVRNLVRALDILEVPRRPEKKNLLVDFGKWLNDARRGKGIIPSLPPSVRKVVSKD